MKKHIQSSFYFEGHWENISKEEIDYYKSINKDDWALERLNHLPFKYEVVIQAIARQEEKYLKEWIEHHINLGIEHIFLYDNNDEDGLDDFLKNTLNEYYYSKIDVIPFHDYHDMQQYDALYDAVNKHKYEAKWFLSIDIDEFLYLEVDIKTFLQMFSDASQIYLSWESFNADGQLYYEDKPVMERFKQTFQCLDAGQGKILFRPTRLKKWGIHSATLTKGKTVNVLHQEIIPPQSFANIYQVAWIKHYFTKSLEEWNEKIKRGCCDKYYCRRYSSFFEINKDLKDYYDDKMLRIQKHTVGNKN